MLSGSPPFYSRDKNQMFKNILEVSVYRVCLYIYVYYRNTKLKFLIKIVLKKNTICFYIIHKIIIKIETNTYETIFLQ